MPQSTERILKADAKIAKEETDNEKKKLPVKFTYRVHVDFPDALVHGEVHSRRMPMMKKTIGSKRITENSKSLPD